MAYRIGWYIEGRIIFSKLWGTQSREDGTRVNYDLSKLLNSSDVENVYIIVDSGELENSPPPSMALLSSTFTALRHPNLSWFIAVGRVSMMNNIMGIMLGQLFRLKYRKIATIEQALDFIRSRDKTIDWSLADPTVINDKLDMNV